MLTSGGVPIAVGRPSPSRSSTRHARGHARAGRDARGVERRDRRVGRGDRRSRSHAGVAWPPCSAFRPPPGSGRRRRDRSIVADAARAASWSRRSSPNPAHAAPRDASASRSASSTTAVRRGRSPPPARPHDAATAGDAIRPSGETATLRRRQHDATSAVVGRALDGHGQLIALGCVDLPGSSLVRRTASSQVALPLRDAVPIPVGTLRGHVADRLRAAAGGGRRDRRSLARPRRLPARSGPAAARLHHRRAVAGDGGRPARLLAEPRPRAARGRSATRSPARRGRPIANAGGAVTSCRGGPTGRARPASTRSRWGCSAARRRRWWSRCPRSPTDAAHILDSVTLGSTLDVQADGPPGRIRRHAHAGQRRLLGAAATRRRAVALAPLRAPRADGLPRPRRPRDGLLIIDNHGFSLRLGRVARVGFGAVALAPRLPAPATRRRGRSDRGARGAGARQGPDGSDVAGCAAIDARLCPQSAGGAGLPRHRLLRRPRRAGRAARRRRSTPRTGPASTSTSPAPRRCSTRSGDGSAHQLGSNLDDPTAPASWSVDLRTAAGRSQLSATFVGLRDVGRMASVRDV